MNHLLEAFKLISLLEEALSGENAKIILNDVEAILQKLKSIKSDFESKEG